MIGDPIERVVVIREFFSEDEKTPVEPQPMVKYIKASEIANIFPDMSVTQLEILYMKLRIDGVVTIREKTVFNGGQYRRFIICDIRDTDGIVYTGKIEKGWQPK